MKKIIKEKDKEQVKKVFKLFSTTQRRQDKVCAQVRENAKGDFDFYIMSLFAGIIITLGIMIDSTAVVIGGMLIAPLVWPILAMAMGIVMGRSALLQRSLFTVLKSTLVILLAAILFGFLVPDVVVENNELLSRTSPTLYELIIGLAAGFIGAFIVAYPKLGSAIAGVVVAAALVPPIATMGISLARGDFSAFGGSFLLYLSNLIAITFAAAILFLLAKYKPRSEQAEEKKATGFQWTLIVLTIIIIPLVLITKNTATEVRVSKVVKDVVYSSLENADVSQIDLQKKENVFLVDLTIRYDHDITEEQVVAMENILEKRLEQITVLRIKIIPIVEAGSGLFSSLDSSNIIEKVVSEPEEKELEKADVPRFIECPIEINNQKVTRLYPVNIGCPICPKIISCGDGREFPAQEFNQDSGLCDDIEFDPGQPCNWQIEEKEMETEEHNDYE